MSLEDASNVVGAARFAMNPTPLGAAMLGIGLLGGIGGSKPHNMGGTPGNYYVTNQKFAHQGTGYMDQFMVQGDKGTYNLLSAIGKAYKTNPLAATNKTALYKSLDEQLGDDQLAKQNLKALIASSDKPVAVNPLASKPTALGGNMPDMGSVLSQQNPFGDPTTKAFGMYAAGQGHPILYEGANRDQLLASLKQPQQPPAQPAPQAAPAPAPTAQTLTTTTPAGMAGQNTNPFNVQPTGLLARR